VHPLTITGQAAAAAKEEIDTHRGCSGEAFGVNVGHAITMGIYHPSALPIGEGPSPALPAGAPMVQSPLVAASRCEQRDRAIAYSQGMRAYDINTNILRQSMPLPASPDTRGVRGGCAHGWDISHPCSVHDDDGHL
jgi:hypothetical protein